MATRKTRSSVVLHQFPAFYACYLLKSVRTTRATATYIGSTPSPPRRIRQHNGEISQGAWKTKHNRPWVMQMIIYGFPTKLAALQFEWAWQHPHISRHLRGKDGTHLVSGSKRSRYLRTNVMVARTMVASPPYTKWPLHVKLFTGELVKIWNSFDKDSTLPPLPLGLIIQVELEGVDGKSGNVGSGRVGAIDVSDVNFTSAHLTKHTALLLSGKQLACAVCRQPMDTYQTDPLASALCPATGCTATSHLTCLAQHFSSAQPTGASMIPRGGECPECEAYTLWGDVVRGGYRRQAGTIVPVPEDADDDLDLELGEVFGSDDSAGDERAYVPAKPRSAASKAKSAAAGAPARKKAKRTATTTRKGLHTAASGSFGGEMFDLNAISADDEDDDAPPILASRVPYNMAHHHHTVLPGFKGGASRINIKNNGRAAEMKATGDEFFDLNGISEGSEDDGAPPAPALAAPSGLTSKTRLGRRPAHHHHHQLSGTNPVPTDDFFQMLDPRDDPLHPLDDPSRSTPIFDYPTELRAETVNPGMMAWRAGLALQDGEDDFFAFESGDLDAPGAADDLVDALSTLSVSSSLPSPPELIPAKRKRFVSQEPIEISD